MSGKKLTVPTLHLNGTPKSHLMEALSDALTAVRAASHALAETAPNGRDFYVQQPNGYQQALDEHVARLLKLNEVREELEVLQLAIDAQRR